LYFDNDSRERESKLRFRLNKLAGRWTHSYGFSLQRVDYSNQTRNLVDDFFYDTEIDFYRYGIFAQSSASFFKDRFTLSAGLRADGNSFTENGHDILRTTSPRLALSYKLSESGRWSANASVGRYFKLPPYTVLGFRNNEGAAVNATSSYIRSDHLVAGLEYLLSESARIAVEGFAKWYDDYPVSQIDSISLANKGGDFEVLGNEPVASVGRGRTYGVELLYQQKFNGQFYAIGALTLYKSEFTGFDRSRFIPSTWDNNILISLLGGYKLGSNWEVSMRFRYLGQAPYPPLDREATLDAYPAIILDYSRLGEVRLEPFSQLDMRVDKKWNFRKVSLDLYLDIQNLLGTALPEPPLYGLARNEAGELEDPRMLVVVNAENTGEVIPSIGLVLNF
ncbi:MAG: TonB-dependent receptor, partial [Saprospiraceae bacterium]|nr:TonB-dependent receptor [Saprospiraceae bacterium]